MSIVEPRTRFKPATMWRSYWQVWQATWYKQQHLQAYRQQVVLIRAAETRCQALDEAAFCQHGRQFLQLGLQGRLFHDVQTKHDALAWLSEAAWRTVNMRPYDVQLVCALAMLDGKMVQLAPGEGKTLTLAMVAAMRGWTGQPCHLVTANAYLASRDADLMRPLYAMAGLDVAAVSQEDDEQSKRQAYKKAVVYSTAQQLLADYLQDVIGFGGLVTRQRLHLASMKAQAPSLLMRGLHTVIVDEADSVLIDDATTPLIISAPEPNPLLEAGVMAAKQMVDLLSQPDHFHLDAEDWDIRFTAKGLALLQQHRETFPKLWQHQERLEDLVKQAILARDKFKLDEQFVIQDGEVVLVDESTGRLMPGRSWSYGLHQAVEARVGVEITPPSKTMEKMSFQSFFQSYHLITGASGTLQNVHAELYHTYHLTTLEVPTRRPRQLMVSDFQCFRTHNEKQQVLLAEVQRLHLQGKPILIGVRRINDSEALSQQLDALDLSHDVLNAKQLDKEAKIVAKAGQFGRITIATNMAGRGTDIAVPDGVLEMGGLTVLMMEPHETSRIDWQLFGRAGRQGNPGQAKAYACLEDSLFTLHLRGLYRPVYWLLQWACSRHPHLTNRIIAFAQQRAQNKAFKQRKQLVKLTRLSQERMSFIKNKTLLRSD